MDLGHQPDSFFADRLPTVRLEAVARTRLNSFYVAVHPDGNAMRRSPLLLQDLLAPTKATTTLKAVLSADGNFFPNFALADVTTEPWGTLTFTFTDCNNGVAGWNSIVPDYRGGSLPIVRPTKIGGTVCP